MSTHQSRKRPIKDLHGNVLPIDTTFVIEDLSTPERPLYTKQLIEADHGVTWQYTLQPHPPSLFRRCQLYSAPAPLFKLTARTAYTALCNTHSTLVLPFVERFRQSLQDSAFFVALLHLNVKLTNSNAHRHSDHPTSSTSFASTAQLLEYPLCLTFTDSVPLTNQVISPSLFAAVSHARTPSEFTQLDGNADHLDYLLHHGHVELAAADDSDSSDTPAHIQATLLSGIHQVRCQLLCSADTTHNFRHLGGTQHELEYLLRHDHLLLDSHPADFLSGVDAILLPPWTSLLQYDSLVSTKNFGNKVFTCITTRWTRLPKTVSLLHHIVIPQSPVRLTLIPHPHRVNLTQLFSSRTDRMLSSMNSRNSSERIMSQIRTYDHNWIMSTCILSI